MKKIIVNGKAHIFGEIEISGSKNASLPVLFATVLTDGISEIEGLADIGDVRVTLEILSCLGAEITTCGRMTYINTKNLKYSEIPESLTASLRASTYLIGALLSRFGKCKLSSFGGCNFANRPIDMHLDACRMLGAEVFDDAVFAKALHGGDIRFSKASVGATVNAILMCVTASGDSRIYGYAKEPHIDSLIEFLASAGAFIQKRADHIFISGRGLSGGRVRIIGDMIEAGSYLCASLITDGSIALVDAPISDMDSINDALTSLGADISICGKRLSEKSALDSRYTVVTARPYPAFPTDLQPIVAPIMAASRGGEIYDEVWKTRFSYLDELEKFGVKSEYGVGHARIYESEIKFASANAIDLRAGMACIVCALRASGESEILCADTVLRGYERLVDKLSRLGAEIMIKEY